MSDDAPDEPTRPRRRYSPWTLLAPLALLAVVVMIFTTLGRSCAFKDCGESTAGETKQTQTKTATVKRKRNAHYVVKEGDTAQTIAERFDLTEAEFRACNRQIPDLYNLQIGQFVNVGSKCRGADDDIV